MGFKQKRKKTDPLAEHYLPTKEGVIFHGAVYAASLALYFLATLAQLSMEYAIALAVPLLVAGIVLTFIKKKTWRLIGIALNVLGLGFAVSAIYAAGGYSFNILFSILALMIPIAAYFCFCVLLTLNLNNSLITTLFIVLNTLAIIAAAITWIVLKDIVYGFALFALLLSLANSISLKMYLADTSNMLRNLAIASGIITCLGGIAALIIALVAGGGDCDCGDCGDCGDGCDCNGSNNNRVVSKKRNLPPDSMYPPDVPPSMYPPAK